MTEIVNSLMEIRERIDAWHKEHPSETIPIIMAKSTLLQAMTWLAMTMEDEPEDDTRTNP